MWNKSRTGEICLQLVNQVYNWWYRSRTGQICQGLVRHVKDSCNMSVHVEICGHVRWNERKTFYYQLFTIIQMNCTMTGVIPYYPSILICIIIWARSWIGCPPSGDGSENKPLREIMNMMPSGDWSDNQFWVSSWTKCHLVICHRRSYKWVHEHDAIWWLVREQVMSKFMNRMPSGDWSENKLWVSSWTGCPVINCKV